jgi:threonine dehydrogenase-like Zn-dependent dehydrogenase
VVQVARAGNPIQVGHAVWFEEQRRAVIREEPVGRPQAGQLTVQARASLISRGTEMLAYRGQISPDMDLGLETCAGTFAFPVKYGYQVVGEVVAAGSGVPLDVGDLVFARHPHQDLFTMRYNPDLVFRLPRGTDPEVGTFANLAEVALNALLDVPVRIGDVVIVFGQGIVGLFCALFARKTAGRLIVVDPHSARRQRALGLGADMAVDPADVAKVVAEATSGRGADVAIEASGAPRALQQAIVATGQEGTIVAVGYYGARPVLLTLAPEFHFRRQHIVSSQVSSVGSGIQTRWDFSRRRDAVLSLLAELPVKEFITHRFTLNAAPEAYALVDTQADATLGVLFDYAQFGPAPSRSDQGPPG